MRKTWIFNEFVTVLFFVMYRYFPRLLCCAHCSSHTSSLSRLIREKEFFFVEHFFFFCSQNSSESVACAVRIYICFLLEFECVFCVFLGDLIWWFFIADRQFSVRRNKAKEFVSKTTEKSPRRIMYNKWFQTQAGLNWIKQFIAKVE